MPFLDAVARYVYPIGYNTYVPDWEQECLYPPSFEGSVEFCVMDIIMDTIMNIIMNITIAITIVITIEVIIEAIIDVINYIIIDNNNFNIQDSKKIFKLSDLSLLKSFVIYDHAIDYDHSSPFGCCLKF